MKTFILPPLQENLKEEEDICELTHVNRMFTRNLISIPGFDNYKTLKCDFHTHTVFSDGLVWPDARVYEAWQEGLDAIAITDHIEHRPNKEILKGDLNESYKIAKKAADDMDFIVIPGAEITRFKPLGHLNALFVKDVTPLDVKDPMQAIAEAKKQGAFIMWNHPGWPDNKATLYPIHEQLIGENRIDGIEVMSYKDYYPTAFNWCVRWDKAFMANTDAHVPVAGMYKQGMLRPLTLVFASEKSERAIREALFAGRTAALFDGILAGRKEHLALLVKASLQCHRMRNNCMEVSNHSDIPYSIIQGGNHYCLPAKKSVLIMPQKGSLLTIGNCFVDKNERLTIPAEELFNPSLP